jgi:hypothetical protein
VRPFRCCMFRLMDRRAARELANRGLHLLERGLAHLPMTALMGDSGVVAGVSQELFAFLHGRFGYVEDLVAVVADVRG